jgi:hypothetical protein
MKYVCWLDGTELIPINEAEFYRCCHCVRVYSKLLLEDVDNDNIRTEN